jgi:hypothetical protein
MQIKNLMFPLLLLLFLCALTIGLVREYLPFRRRTASAEGRVLRVRWERGRRGSRVAFPDIEFLDSRGQRIEFHSRIGASWNPRPAGSSVQVFYDPEDPTNAEIKPTRGMVLFLVGVISVLIVWFELLEYLTVFGKWDLLRAIDGHREAKSAVAGLLDRLRPAT